MPKVSFIVPAYNEQDNILPFYEEFSQVFGNSGLLWELVFVDDGSSDGTWDQLLDLVSKRPHVTAIQFSRNFGKESAIWAGLNNADGEFIGIIDADLQQPPSDALAMCQILLEDSNVDCVAAYQENRSESKVMTKVKGWFYKIFAKMSELDTVQDASDFRVFRRRVAQAIMSMPENFRFTKGIFSWVGFNTFPYPYTPKERTAGSSKWSVVGLTKYAIEGMVSFSTAPLKIATGLGTVISFLAIAYVIYTVVKTVVMGVDVPGYATLLCAILLLGGAQLICMGIMGEYLARAYLQGKNRPIYIERARIESGEGMEDDSPASLSANL